MNFKNWLIGEEEAECMDALAVLCEVVVFGKKLDKKYRDILKPVMPKGKQKHSMRVANRVRKLLKPSQDQFPDLKQQQWNAIMVGIFHDYLERGGDHSVLQKLGLSGKTIQAINNLAVDKDTADPLEHLQSVLPTLDNNLKNIVILVKLSDRIDNLKRRDDNSDLGKKYIARSAELVNWLFQQYTGDPQHLYVLRKRFRDLGVKARKKYIMLRQSA